jgi:D-alanyl-D-alanine carboxypeptidase (penicillin-binding protein 5/6)
MLIVNQSFARRVAVAFLAGALATAGLTPAALEARADAITTAAKEAIVIDFDTGAILLDKNADEEMVPSSMSKLMTVYLVFDRLKKGSLKLTDKLPVTETAWKRHYKTGESLMFLPVNSQVSVEELLKGVIVQSGNDACSVLAEGLAGSEQAFADLETKRGQEIGLTHSAFKNASGVPEPGHYMTAHDLAILATRLIKDFPEFYPMFDERKFAFNNINQDNRNPLFYRNVEGADGLKTGHTEEGGYGVTGTALRNGRRVIVVVNGLPSIKARADESQNLIEWGFREFEDRHLLKAGDSVADAQVWLGQAPTVPVTVAEDVIATVPRVGAADMKVTANYDAPIPAPIKKGQKVGTLTVDVPGLNKRGVALLAGTDVARLGALGRVFAAARHILGGS